MDTPLSLRSDQTATARRILVADDEATLRMGISYTLADGDTTVDLAEDGFKALEMLATQRYDLLMIDLRMPDLDGMTAIETLRASGNRIPILLCSAEFTPGIFDRAVRCNVIDFLLKPASPDQIRRAVELVIGNPEDAHSIAMAAARGGDVEAAVSIFERSDSLTDASQKWLKIFRSLCEDSKVSGDACSDVFSAVDIGSLALNAKLGA